MKDYQECVENFRDRFIKVTLKDETVDKINKLAEDIAQKKIFEQHHMRDSGSERKRFSTGFLGEAALSNILKRPIIDWAIGDSKDYNKADLSKLGLKVGIKTVGWGYFPVIFKNSYYPEIIVLKDKPNELYVAGLATVDVLKTYQDDELIVSPNLRSRGVKTGFWGFEHLKKFHNLEELKALLRS